MPHHLAISMEYAAGGDLSEYVQDNKLAGVTALPPRPHLFTPPPLPPAGRAPGAVDGRRLVHLLISRAPQDPQEARPRPEAVPGGRTQVART